MRLFRAPLSAVTFSLILLAGGQTARADALVFALERGSRSGRVAHQFARDYAGKNNLPA